MNQDIKAEDGLGEKVKFVRNNINYNSYNSFPCFFKYRHWEDRDFNVCNFPVDLGKLVSRHDYSRLSPDVNDVMTSIKRDKLYYSHTTNPSNNYETRLIHRNGGI